MSANRLLSFSPPAEWLDGPPGETAVPTVRSIYDDISAHLRVSFLGPFWRSLAWDERLFETIWASVAPVMALRTFEVEAASIRRQALIVEAATMPSHQAFKADLVRAEIEYDMRERIGNYNAAVVYGLSKTLVVASWLLQPADSDGERPSTRGEIPLGVAAGAVAVTPVPSEQRRGRVAELLDEIPHVHGHPLADEYFQALARLTDYLNAAWNALRPIVRDEPYDERGHELTRLAEAAVTRLPAKPEELQQTIEMHPDASRLRVVLTYFVHRHLPDILIDAAIIKALTEGPERADVSPFELPNAPESEP